MGLEALPCGARGFMRGGQPLHLPICGRSARAWPCHARRPGGFCKDIVPAPTYAGAPPCTRVTFSPMRKSPKNLPEGRPLWVLPLGGIIIPPAARACMRLLLPPERVCATNPDRFATLRWVGESVFFLPRFLRGHTFCFQTVARWGGWLLRFRAKVDFILRCIDRCRAPC